MLYLLCNTSGVLSGCHLKSVSNGCFLMVAQFLNKTLYFPVVLILIVNLLQRRHMKEGLAKRYATLYIGLILLLLWGFTFLMIRFGIPDWLLIPYCLVGVTVTVLARSKVVPFRLKCSR